jgi:hypothetical protein
MLLIKVLFFISLYKIDNFLLHFLMIAILFRQSICLLSSFIMLAYPLSINQPLFDLFPQIGVFVPYFILNLLDDWKG